MGKIPLVFGYILTVAATLVAAKGLASVAFPYATRCQLLINSQSVEKSDEFWSAFTKLETKQQQKVEVGLKELIKIAASRPGFLESAKFENERNVFESLFNDLNWQPLFEFLRVGEGGFGHQQFRGSYEKVESLEAVGGGLEAFDRGGFEVAGGGLEAMVFEAPPQMSEQPTEVNTRLLTNRRVYDTLNQRDMVLTAINEMIGTSTSAEKTTLAPVIAKVDQLLMMQNIEEAAAVTVRFEPKMRGFASVGSVLRSSETSKVELAQAGARVKLLKELLTLETIKNDPAKKAGIEKLQKEWQANFDRISEEYARSYFDATQLRRHIEKVGLSDSCSIACRASAVRMLAESGFYDEISTSSRESAEDPLYVRLRELGITPSAYESFKGKFEQEMKESYLFDWQAFELLASNPSVRERIMKNKSGRGVRNLVAAAATSDILWRVVYHYVKNVPIARNLMTFHANENARYHHLGPLLSLARENLTPREKLDVLKNMAANDATLLVTFTRLSDVSRLEAELFNLGKEIHAGTGDYRLLMKQWESARKIGESHGPMSATYTPGVAERMVNYGMVTAAVTAGIASQLGIQLPFSQYFDTKKLEGTEPYKTIKAATMTALSLEVSLRAKVEVFKETK